jgi:flagellar biosynthetic protein FlhB
MADDSDLEKTEQASPKRVEKAREDGDVPRSKELATCMLLFAAGLGFLMFGSGLSAAMKGYFIDAFNFKRDAVFNSEILLNEEVHGLTNVLLALLPLGLILFVVAMFSQVIIGGWNFNVNALVPNFNRLNPLRGITNMISTNALVELIKAILKATVVGIIAFVVISTDYPAILSLSMMPLAVGISSMGSMLVHGFLMIVFGLVLIAAIDVPYQLMHYSSKLKMTKEEVRQESKEANGNPEIKARVRQQQREVARRRMMAEIPKADVIITNPTHYAVAIKYTEGGVGAPKLIAKGADEVALRIRQIAKDNKVPMLESPKLARALFAHSELGDEIPVALYSAVAEVLAFVYQLRTFNQQGGAYPNEPKNVQVPDELDPNYKNYEVGVG